jgi:hypothetical protein
MKGTIIPINTKIYIKLCNNNHNSNNNNNNHNHNNNNSICHSPDT